MKTIIYTDKIENYQKSPEVYRLNKSICFSDRGGMGNISEFSLKNFPKTKNTFVHVFWSKPSFKNSMGWNAFGQYEITIALSALSLGCLKEFGQKVILITDTKGKELLQDLPYDEIHTILDDYDIPDKFWAAGKIAALKYLPNDVILIDNDLFLYDGKLIDRINENDVVCCVEETNTMNFDGLDVGLSNIPWLIKGNIEKTSQTSILKVNNPFLKNLFITTYYEIVSLLTDETGSLKKGMEKTTAPDLIAEQFNFHCLCNPTPVLHPRCFWADIKELCHLVSNQKYRKLPIVLDKLYYYFPDYYYIVMSKWKELNFSIKVD